MKLASFCYLSGGPRLGAVIEGADGTKVCDLASASLAHRASQPQGGFPLPSDMVEFLRIGEIGFELAQKVAQWATEMNVAIAPIEAVELLAPVPTPPKVLALAGNYQEHIVEGGGNRVEKDTSVPMLFMKPSTTIVGTHHPLTLPSRISQTVDWELELCVVIGRQGKYVSPATALDYVAGYTIFNDISSRSLEIVKNRTETTPRQSFFDWLNGKWQDGYGPMGPYLVTKDEVPNPQNLSMRLSVNSEVRQDGSTAQMIFTVAETVAWASQLVTLAPGDVIATGTPSGVGSASGTFLKPGDSICAEIEGLGSLVTPVIAEEADA